MIHSARALRGWESPAQLAPLIAGIRERLTEHGQPPVYLSAELTSQAAAHFVWTYLCGQVRAR